MATNLGSAYVTVNAVTKNFGNQVQKGLSGAGRGADVAGRRVGGSFGKGFSRAFGSSSRNIFSPQFFRNASAAQQQFQRLVRLGFTLGPIITFIVGAIGALANGLFMVAAAVGAASPALIVFVAGLVAIGQAAVVASIALKGVGEAIGAGFQAQTAKGTKSTKDLTAALDRVEDARRRLARTTEQAAERIAEANERVLEAEENYIDAQIESRKAAQDLASAREEAAEDLQQLRFETEGAAISEQKARLEFERSRESLQRVQDLPPNSRARREAELAFAEADLNLRRAIDRNTDLKKAEREATAAGVDGSEKVQNATEKLNEAQKNELKALQGIAKAQQNAATVQRDALRSIADAQRDVERALRDLNKAQNDSTGAANKYKESLDKLSPQARSFVELIVANRDAFIALRDAAGRQLFPQLESAFLTILPKFEELEVLLEGTGKALGVVAQEFADTFAEGENFSRLERVWRTNDRLITDFGDATSNLYEILLILLDAAEPLIKEFGEWTKTVTEGWRETLKAKDATGELRENFITAGKFAKDIIGIIKDLSIGLFNIGKAAMGPDGGGTLLIEAMRDATTEFREFTGSVEGQDVIKKYFQDAVEPVKAVSRFIGNIFVAIGKIGTSPGITVFSDKLSEALEIWEDIGETLVSEDVATSLGDLTISLSELIKAFTDSGSIVIFFETLRAVLDPIKEFFQSDVGQQIINTIGPILAVLNAIGLVGKIAIFYFNVVVGSIGRIFLVASTLSNLFFGTEITKAKTLAAFKSGAEKIFHVLRMTLSAIFWGTVKTLQGIAAGARLAQEAAFDAYRTAREAGFSVFRAVLQAIWTGIRTAAELAYQSLRMGLEKAYHVLLKVGHAINKVGMLTMIGLGKTFRLVMLTNPLFWIPALILLIAGGFVMLYKKWEPFRNLVDRTVEALRKAWDFVKKIFGGGGDNEQDNVGNARANSIASARDARPMAEGGIVRPSRYGTLAVIGEAGRSERVEPLDSDGLSVRDRAIIKELSFSGGGGVTVNVYPSEGMDEKELADLVSRKLAYQIRKGEM
jgi:hypothetical protein